MKLPKTFADIQAILVDMHNRIEELEKIEKEKNERLKETSKLIRDLSLKQ